MSVLDDDDIFLSREGPVELYNKSVRWLQEHCGPDIIYEKGTDDKFKSPLITDSGSWLSIDGLSSKVVLKWDDKRGVYVIVPVNPHYYVFIKNDIEPEYLDFSKCDAVFIDGDKRILKDPITREIVFKTHYM